MHWIKNNAVREKVQEDMGSDGHPEGNDFSGVDQLINSQLGTRAILVGLMSISVFIQMDHKSAVLLNFSKYYAMCGLT